MSRTRKTTLIAAVVLLLAAVPLAFAAKSHREGHGFRGGHGFGHGGGVFTRLAMLREELDLSDAQVASLTGIAQQTRKENEQYRDDLRAGFHQIASVLLADPDATGKAQAILDRQLEAEKQLKANVLASVSEALKVLTPEQRMKLQEHLAERAARF